MLALQIISVTLQIIDCMQLSISAIAVFSATKVHVNLLNTWNCQKITWGNWQILMAFLFHYSLEIKNRSLSHCQASICSYKIVVGILSVDFFINWEDQTLSKCRNFKSLALMQDSSRISVHMYVYFFPILGQFFLFQKLGCQSPL